MKGCPEGGEQSFLFSLYRELSEGECPCPHGCGTLVTRSKRDFFPLFVGLSLQCTNIYAHVSYLQNDFSTYITHLRKKVPQRCKSCGNVYCIACGESVSPNAYSSDENECLFHCANLQGAILGVGLAMLEHNFLEEVQAASHDDNQKAKRRKVSANSTPGANDTEDDDEAYPFPMFGVVATARGAQKVRTGTGYAGNHKEDVSLFVRFVSFELSSRLP